MLKIIMAIIQAPFLIALTLLVAAGFCVSSCTDNKMYQDYKNYGSGYEAAQKGESKPSLWSSKEEKEGYDAGLNDRVTNNSNSSIIEFQYTEEEIKATENRWATFEEIINDARKGDANAMFAIGLSYLYGGKGLQIDVAAANIFFSKAASLGHAPSLDKVRAIYLEDSPNPFLHQVYVNLEIAMGHTEFTLEYHRTRSKMMESFGAHGKAIVEEIELYGALLSCVSFFHAADFPILVMI